MPPPEKDRPIECSPAMFAAAVMKGGASTGSGIFVARFATLPQAQSTAIAGSVRRFAMRGAMPAIMPLPCSLLQRAPDRVEEGSDAKGDISHLAVHEEG